MRLSDVYAVRVICVSDYGSGACVWRHIQSVSEMECMGLFRPCAQPLGTGVSVILLSLDRRRVSRGQGGVPDSAVL